MPHGRRQSGRSTFLLLRTGASIRDHQTRLQRPPALHHGAGVQVPQTDPWKSSLHSPPVQRRRHHRHLQGKAQSGAFERGL